LRFTKLGHRQADHEHLPDFFPRARTSLSVFLCPLFRRRDLNGPAPGVESHQQVQEEDRAQQTDAGKHETFEPWRNDTRNSKSGFGQNITPPAVTIGRGGAGIDLAGSPRGLSSFPRVTPSVFFC